MIGLTYSLVRHFHKVANRLCLHNVQCNSTLHGVYPPWENLKAFGDFSDTQHSLVSYRQLEPLQKPGTTSKLLHHIQEHPYAIQGSRRTFLFNKGDKKKKPRRVPRLILIQNPFTWLRVKFDFSVLRNIWDSSFTEKDFKYGTKQAISRVTQVISEGQYSNLNGLLTKPAKFSLMRELDRNWGERQRMLLALNNDDIQISSPKKVYFITLADKKYCDVDMAFLALKWVPVDMIDALIFTEIFARFHREYTPHCIPEWTIAYFRVLRFQVLRQKPKEKV